MVLCSLFRVDNNGRITLKADGTEYEETDYLINVQAMDKGASPRSTTVSVRISLILDHVSSKSQILIYTML